MKKIFVDFEMNPVRERMLLADGSGFIQEIIEFGAVMLDEKNHEIKSFQTYVKPERETEISEKVVRLTGITTAMVTEAPGFAETLASFVRWCGGDYEIFSWSENDLQELQAEITFHGITITNQLDYMLEHWRDFQKEYDAMFHFERRLSLVNAIELSGADFDGRPHGALADARNTANLYRTSLENRDFLKMKDSLEKAAQPCTSAIGSMFDFSKFLTK